MPLRALLFHDDLLGVLLADGGVNAGDDLVRCALGLLTGDHVLAGDDAGGDLVLAEEENVGGIFVLSA